MGSIEMHGRALQATLCEIERGLFHVRYQVGGTEWDGDHLPRYCVGTSTTDAEEHVQQRARELGFEIALVGHELVIPSVADRSTTAVMGTRGVLPAREGTRGGWQDQPRNRALHGRPVGVRMVRYGELPAAEY